MFFYLVANLVKSDSKKKKLVNKLFLGIQFLLNDFKILIIVWIDEIA